MSPRKAKTPQLGLKHSAEELITNLEHIIWIICFPIFTSLQRIPRYTKKTGYHTASHIHLSSETLNPFVLFCATISVHLPHLQHKPAAHDSRDPKIDKTWRTFYMLYNHLSWKSLISTTLYISSTFTIIHNSSYIYYKLKIQLRNKLLGNYT